MVLIGLVLLFLLTQATNNRELYERNYAWLFTINVAVAAMLLCGVAWVGFRLYARLRDGKFGSRLLVKLALIFAFVGLGPGLLIYVVSYQFVSRSIETWFDVKVEGALEAGLNLGRVTLDALASDLSGKSRSAAQQLAESPATTTGLVLERLLEQLNATDVAVWSSSGTLIASAGQASFKLTPDKPTQAQFRTARLERAVSWVEGLEDFSAATSSNARVKVLLPIASASIGLQPDQRYLLVSRALPTNLVANALAVDAAYREYQERALSRDGLKRMYIGTLTLSLFLAVFGAILLAVILGNQIAKPLLVLAEGVSQVAAGDLTPKLAMQGKDELGGLTRAFASMTQQLAEARLTVQHSMERVDASRANLQTILDNLTAGVIVMGAKGEIRSSNPGATRILQIPLREHQGQRLTDIDGLQVFGAEVASQFVEFLAQRAETGADHWQQSFQLSPSGEQSEYGASEKAITLVARGAELPDKATLLVFDDISEIVSAQRAQAWGEVARRLAHEIKNPLTPIQLSAERLEHKLASKLQGTELQILVKSVKTIVDQVDAMKRLVNEFRDYARLPAADLKAVDINTLVSDILQLYETGPERCPVRMELDPSCPLVQGDAQQLRQVIHNLVQNGQDASDISAQGNAVIVRTQWLEKSGRVRLAVLDHGAGFSESILKRAFEPYVTTKARGTGLGLAVVKKIADEHGARIDIGNRIQDGVVVGAQVSLSLNTYTNASA
ncbi:sensor histidine kinase [Rhodoferax aquaticus]|uniref:histidine kinase n=1 Tax=Rhodoferax aquaticus TaxID=2527691 RepID=A0A515EU83_9BURK|nr:ATP-binding protein [Rhodoferax aquaticus]QDL56237.1 HAMP domain-containing protein [Rhodoferax aquaticus]